MVCRILEDVNYISTGRFVFNFVKKLNDNGIYFLFWGTCAWMYELSSYFTVHDVNYIDSASLTLDFACDNPEDI
jgi:hypothetical protein